MAFTLVQPFIDKIDNVTIGYVAQTSQSAAEAIAPVAISGLTLSFIAFGFAIMQGAVQVPFGEFISKCLRISIISAFALTGGLYQTDVAGVITALPDDLARVVAGNKMESAGSIIDNAAGAGFDQAAIAWDKASFLSSDGLVFGLIGMIFALTTAVVVAIGAAFIVMSKLVLAVLAGLGPIFISALLFQATSRFFELWTGQILNYVLLVTLFAGVFTFMLDVFGSYMSDVALDGTQNVAYTLGGALILGVSTAIVLLQLPGIASSLGGGASVGFIHELRQLRRAGKGAMDAGRSAGRSIYQRGEKTADGGRGPARGAAPAAGRGVQRAAGFFKGGRKAA